MVLEVTISNSNLKEQYFYSAIRQGENSSAQHLAHTFFHKPTATCYWLSIVLFYHFTRKHKVATLTFQSAENCQKCLS